MSFSPNTFDVIIWNVEHGLSCSILTPEVSFHNGIGWVTRERMIQVDAGYNGESNFSPLLRMHNAGHTEIDCLAISHPDLDHINDLPNMNQNVHVLLRNGSFPANLISDDPYQEGASKKAFRHYHTTYIHPLFDAWKKLIPENFGGVTIKSTFLQHEQGMDINDTSLVLSIEYKNTQIIFVGDITSSGYARLLANDIAPTINPNSYRFLVASHHGRESSEPTLMLNHIQPHLVFASAKDEDEYTSRLYSSDKVLGYSVNDDLFTQRKFVSTKGAKGIHLSQGNADQQPFITTFQN